MKITVLDADTLGKDLDLSPLYALGDVTAYPTTPPELVAPRIAGCDVVLLNKVKINREVLPPRPDCPSLICIAATGFDNIDLPSCREAGIAVCNVKGYSTDSVAQVTVGLVLTLVCHLPAYFERVRSGAYSAGGVANCLVPVYREISSMTWGVLGAGKIGSRVAGIARAMGARVITCRAHPDGESVDLDTLMSESDIITVHTPLNASTRGLVGARELSLTRPGTIIVNMARGAVTDEAALADAVKSGHLGGLGADVYSVEPFGPDHPFYAVKELQNVCLTPHMSWGSAESRARCLDEMILNIRAFYASQIRNRVDLTD